MLQASPSYAVHGRRILVDVILSNARTERKRGESERRIYGFVCEPMLAEDQQTFVGREGRTKIPRRAQSPRLPRASSE